MVVMAVAKTVRHVVLAVVVLTVSLLLGGVMYAAFFTPHRAFDDMPSAAVAKPTMPYSPVAPGANAKEGVAIESLTPTVIPGAAMSLIAITNAGSHCAITVDAAVVPGADPALAAQTADAYGMVSWNWQVKGSALVGSHDLAVTCMFHAKTAVVQASFIVEK